MRSLRIVKRFNKVCHCEEVVTNKAISKTIFFTDSVIVPKAFGIRNPSGSLRKIPDRQE